MSIRNYFELPDRGRVCLEPRKGVMVDGGSCLRKERERLSLMLAALADCLAHALCHFLRSAAAHEAFKLQKVVTAGGLDTRQKLKTF